MYLDGRLIQKLGLAVGYSEEFKTFYFALTSKLEWLAFHFTFDLYQYRRDNVLHYV